MIVKLQTDTNQPTLMQGNCNMLYSVEYIFVLILSVLLGIFIGYVIRRNNANDIINNEVGKPTPKQSPYALEYFYSKTAQKHCYRLLYKGEVMLVDKTEATFVFYHTRSSALTILNEYERTGGYQITK